MYLNALQSKEMEEEFHRLLFPLTEDKKGKDEMKKERGDERHLCAIHLNDSGKAETLTGQDGCWKAVGRRTEALL